MTVQKLSRRRVLAGVQSSVDPPNKIALGERAATADGNDFNVMRNKEHGRPVEIVDPVEVEARAVEIKARYQKIVGV